MKKLVRSRRNRKLAGVCGGLATYLEIDVTVIRLLAIVITLISVGLGLVGYLGAWLIMPEEDSEA